MQVLARPSPSSALPDASRSKRIAVAAALYIAPSSAAARAQGPEKIVRSELTEFILDKGETATALFPAAFDRQMCSPIGPPKIEIMGAPRNGRLSLDEPLYPVPKGRCLGKSMPADRIVYTPNAGFAGTDRFSARVTTSLYRAGKVYSSHHDTFAIAVR